MPSGTLYIARAINRYGEITQGKNENALRSFELNQYALEAYFAQLYLLRSSGVPTRKHDPLFPMRNQQSLYNHWKKYQESNGIPPVSLYELRHTFVSIAQSLPDDLLKPVVGHSRSMDSINIFIAEIILAVRSLISVSLIAPSSPIISNIDSIIRCFCFSFNCG